MHACSQREMKFKFPMTMGMVMVVAIDQRYLEIVKKGGEDGKRKVRKDVG